MGFFSKLLADKQPNKYFAVVFQCPSDWDNGKDHDSATLHDKEKIKYLVDTKDNIRDFLAICTENDNPYFRSAAMENAMRLIREDDSSLSKNDMDTLKLIIKNDDNVYVYYIAMRYLMNTKEKQHIDFIKEIAVTSSSPKKRSTALFEMIFFSRYNVFFEVPLFIKERVLIDENNFIRREVVRYILRMNLDAGPNGFGLTEFAIQWVKYTGTESQMGACSPRIQQTTKDNKYFNGEERDLLII